MLTSPTLRQRFCFCFCFPQRSFICFVLDFQTKNMLHTTHVNLFYLSGLSFWSNEQPGIPKEWALLEFFAVMAMFSFLTVQDGSHIGSWALKIRPERLSAWVSWGANNNMPRTGWLKQQLWTAEVQDQGVSSTGPFWEPWGEDLLHAPLEVSRGLMAIFGGFLGCEMSCQDPCLNIRLVFSPCVLVSPSKFPIYIRPLVILD